jgi:hypothetical protein
MMLAYLNGHAMAFLGDKMVSGRRLLCGTLGGNHITLRAKPQHSPCEQYPTSPARLKRREEGAAHWAAPSIA